MTRLRALLLAVPLLTATPGIAGAQEAAGFQPIERPATPGEILAAEQAEKERIARADEACRTRRSTGEKVGIGVGVVAGVVGGLLAADSGRDTQQIAAGIVGAAIGSTAGAVAGEALDPRADCGFVPPDAATPVPAVAELIPRTSKVERLNTIGAGPEPLPDAYRFGRD